MKNRQSIILILITCMCAAFTLGFLTGRASAPGDTIISRMPEATVASTEAPLALPVVAETAAATIPAETTAPAETTPAAVPTETTAVSTEPAIVTTVPATVPPETVAPTEPKNSGLININTATAAQLDTLPGIGEVLAQRIIDYREANGPFTHVSQLMLVDGIGEKRLAAILDLITIE